MLIKLKLVEKWGEYGKGSVVMFGESKGLPLIAAGIAIRTNEKEKKVVPTNKTMKLKLLKRWGEYGVGSVVRFGQSKGMPLIAAGVAVRTDEKEKRLKTTGKKSPGTETAKIDPVVETADAKTKADPNAKSKAKDKADAEAEAKSENRKKGGE